MRRLIGILVIGALLGTISTNSMFKNNEEDNTPTGRDAVYSSEIPVDEIREKGAIGYIVDKTEATVQNMSGEAKEKELSNWEKGFINARDGLNGAMMVIDSSGASVKIGEGIDKSQYTRLEERCAALMPVTVSAKITQDELFDYIRDYKNRGVWATKELEEKLKADTGCEYDLRFDYIYVTENDIILTMIYDNGFETDAAITLSEMVGFMKSLVDYI